MRPDLLVVGGGVIGLSSAWVARRSGRSVSVLERADIGAGASGAAAGMLLPDVEGENDPEEREFGRQSYALYPDFVAEVEEASGLGTRYRATDCYLVAQTAERAGELRRLDYGEWLGPDALREALPGIGEVIGARRGAAAQIEPRLLLAALAAALAAEGVEILRGVQVTDVAVGEGAVRGLRLGDGRRLEAGAYIFAPGAWAGGLAYLARRGVAVEPVKGQMVSLLAEEEMPLRGIVFGEGVYFAPKSGGRVFLGATQERVGFDDRPTAEGALRLLEGMRRLHPGGLAWSVRETWAGLRPWRRGGPLVARLDANAVVAAGHYRNGILLAPETARRTVALLP